MVADPNHARRPALPGIRRRFVAALLCAPLLLWPTVSTASPATAASTVTGTVPTATDDGSVAIDVTPSGSSVLHLNQPLQLSVTVTNDTADTVAAGSIDIFLAERALTTRTALDDWLNPDDNDNEDAGDLMTSVALDSTVQPHSTVTVAVTVPFASLGLFEWSPWGPRGISASLNTEDSVRASAQSTFVWYPDNAETPITPVTPVNLTVMMPITTPATTTGLISADDLTTYTAPSGILTRQLDGVVNRSVAIGIDPMIIASIRVLGTAAPVSAIEWLNRLAQADNDIFPLGYADADPSLAVQAGASGVLTPTSLAFATNPEAFVPTEQTALPDPQDGTSESNIPEPTSSEAPTEPGEVNTVPTLDQLLAWDYTSTTIAWPTDNVVAQADLEAFAGSGLTTTVLAGGNVTVDSDAIANTTVELGSTELGLVSDTDISNALRTAITATTDEDWRGAIAELSSQIAVVAVENPDRARTLLATIDRGWPPTSSRLSQTIDALTALPWYTATPLTTALATPVSTGVTFAPQAEPDESIDLARRLIEREAELTSFSTALADPTAVLAPNRLALLALLATSWEGEPSEWRTAVGDNLAASHDTLRSVTVSTKGPINVVGSKVDIPVTLNNALGQAVTVRVQVVPSNGRLVVGNDVEAVLDASSAKTVSIPVTAAVGNGAVTLRVTLFTPTGESIAQPSLISVNVRADWEGIGSRIFAALVVLFFGFGIWRNIVHRRRDRALAAQHDADPDADLEAGVDASPTGSIEVLPATSTTPAPVDPTTCRRHRVASQGGVGRASAILASGTLVSRLLGFLKVIVFARVIGQFGQSADAFALANQLPNTVYTIVAGGVLTAVLVPQIVRASLHDDGGTAYINKLVTLALGILAATTLAATLLAPLITRLIGPGYSPDQMALAIAFAYWCLPQIFFYGLYTVLGEVLNARKSFGPYTWVPVINNVIAIGGLLVFMALFGADPLGHRLATDFTPAMIALLAGSATLGVVLQSVVLYYFWRRIGLRYRPDFRFRGVGLGAAGKMASWTFGMLLITTLAGIVETRVVSSSSGDDASVAVLGTAWLIFMLPHSIITVSVATAYFTRMSEHASRGDTARLRTDASSAIRGTTLLIVVASAVIMVCAYPFAAVFVHESFAQTQALGNVILAYLLGLVAFCVLFVVQRTFYALGDTKTPFYFTLFQVVLVVAGVVSCSALPQEWRAFGIALVVSISGILQAFLAAWLLRKRLGGIDGKRILRSLVKYLVAVAVPVAVGLGILVALGGTTDGGFAVSGIAPAIVSMALIGAVMAGLYFGLLLLMRSQELHGFIAPLKARLRR